MMVMVDYARHTKKNDENTIRSNQPAPHSRSLPVDFSAQVMRAAGFFGADWRMSFGENVYTVKTDRHKPIDRPATTENWIPQ